MIMYFSRCPTLTLMFELLINEKSLGNFTYGTLNVSQEDKLPCSLQGLHNTSTLIYEILYLNERAYLQQRVKKRI